MKLSPLDIKKQAFKKIFRGYDPIEVDTFLEMIAAEMDDLVTKNKDMQERLSVAEAQVQDYKSIEKTLHATLLQAQDVSTKSVENAKYEGKLVIQEAEIKSSQILDKARSENSRLKEEIEILKAKKNTLSSRLKLLLTSELELIRALDINEDIPISVTEEIPVDQNQNEYDDIIKSIEENN